MKAFVEVLSLVLDFLLVLSHAVNIICPLYATIIYSKNETCKMWYLYSRMQFEVLYFMDIVLFVL